MKRYLLPTSILPLAVMFFATTFAAPASAKDLRIEGSLEAAEDHIVTPPTMLVQLEGVGCASHLGRFVLTIEATVFLPTSASQGVFEIDTGCGNSIRGTLVGQATRTDGVDAVPIAETLTITGGTGRFKGATGTLRIQRVGSQSTFISSGTIEGTVILPDRRRGRRR